MTAAGIRPSDVPSHATVPVHSSASITANEYTSHADDGSQSSSAKSSGAENRSEKRIEVVGNWGQCRNSHSDAEVDDLCGISVLSQEDVGGVDAEAYSAMFEVVQVHHASDNIKRELHSLARLSYLPQLEGLVKRHSEALHDHPDAPDAVGLLDDAENMHHVAVVGEIRPADFVLDGRQVVLMRHSDHFDCHLRSPGQRARVHYAERTAAQFVVLLDAHVARVEVEFLHFVQVVFLV
jgi:hypothetical protein